MSLLAFDIATGGISAALYDADLHPLQYVEQDWDIAADETGAATITLPEIVNRFRNVLRKFDFQRTTLEAVSFACFMHNCVLLDDDDLPMTPVFTWLDRRGDKGLEFVRSRMGDRFHEHTGCRLHPMFPVFKLATLHLQNSDLIARARRVVSVKAYLIHRLTDAWIEDYGMASASGLFNIRRGDWDPAILELAGLKHEQLPPVGNRNHIAGSVTSAAAADFGIPEGVKVVNGSGDGFLANAGSGCESPESVTVTLGTSASARQTLPVPVLDNDAGTFCYKLDDNSFLLGCAGSNGGNVLNWARSLFGDLPASVESSDLPTFIPLLHGERSPEWDSRVTGSWHGLTSQHRAQDLARSVLEGVLFNLAYFVEILERTSDQDVTEIVLSGNGFRQPDAPAIFATVANAQVWMPAEPGLASLRGAAICALRALNLQVPGLNAVSVAPSRDPQIEERYRRYKDLRLAAGSGYLQSL